MISKTNKIKSLGIDSYIDDENIFITGDYGQSFYKPNTAIVDEMKLPRNKEVLYFGDRDIDREFADKLNWQFINVQGMKEVL